MVFVQDSTINLMFQLVRCITFELVEKEIIIVNINGRLIQQEDSKVTQLAD